MLNSLFKQFLEACYRNDVGEVQKILDNGLNISSPTNTQLMNVYIHLFESDDNRALDLLSILISHGLSPDNYFYALPQTIMSEYEYFLDREEVPIPENTSGREIEFLIQNGSDINYITQISNQGYVTPLDVALSCSHTKAEKLLRNAGALCFDQMYFEQSLLHMQLDYLYQDFGVEKAIFWINTKKHNSDIICPLSICTSLFNSISRYIQNESLKEINYIQFLINNFYFLKKINFSNRIQSFFILSTTWGLEYIFPHSEIVLNNLFTILDQLNIKYNQPGYQKTFLDFTIEKKQTALIPFLRQRGAKTFDELMQEGLLHKNPCSLNADSMPYIYVPPGETLEEALTDICG